MMTEGHPDQEMTEEQLRAAYEAEIKRVRVEHVLFEDVVTLINLGLRRTGAVPGTEDERDPEQAMLAVDSVRALLPMLERAAPAQAAQIKEALSQLQLAFVRSGGGAASAQTAAGTTPPATGTASGTSTGEAPNSEPIKPGEPGPAQRSGRLWVPGS